MRARIRGLLGAQRSLRRRVARLAVVGLLVLAAQLATQLVSGRLAQVRGFEALRLETVRNEAIMLEGSVDAQRSSLLRYRAGGQASYAASYAADRQDSARLLARLRSDVTDARQAAAVRAMGPAIDAWEAWGQDQVAGSGPLTDADVDTGETLYEAVLAAQRNLSAVIADDIVDAGKGADVAGIVAFVTSLAGSLAAAAVLVVLVMRILQLGVLPVVRLAGTARRIALGEPASIEAAATDEVQELATALEAWQQAAAERAIVAEQAPTGIVRVDLDGRIVSVNRAIELLHRLPADQLHGRPVDDVIHPADRDRILAARTELESGGRPSVMVEARALRTGGAAVWCSITAGRLLSADGRPVGTIAVIEDISERKLQAERAARIQRELWPAGPPLLDGYDVAGSCLPAQEVAGDLYDWRIGEDGRLELTVADVMGKGIGAALVAAMLRTALRAAPAGLGPAAKLSLASSSMPLGRYDDDTFVTTFHALLDPRTGVLTYVDAGHGYCHVMRRGGDLLRLPARSLPLGVEPDAGFEEGSLRLERGDTLVVYSDGLVEQPDLPEGRPVLDDVRGAADAAGLVHGLLDRMPPHLTDDVTAVAVRRA